MERFGPSSVDAGNRGASTQRLINCFRQATVGSKRTAAALKSVPGTENFADTSTPLLYGVGRFSGSMYVAAGGRLFKVSDSGTVTDLGAISSGEASFSSNTDSLVLTAAGSLYTVQADVITQQAPTPFISIGSVDFLDQYTLYTELNGRQFGWSDLADPTSYPGTNFAAAEATDEDIIRGIVVNSRVILFKEEGREVWYNTGQSGANAFLRVAGGVRNVGLKSYGLATKTDEALFWVGNDNICRLTLDGLNSEKLSYPPVNIALERGNPTHCFYTEEDGQKFCHIRFSDRPTWVFNLASGEWHERAEGGAHDPWTVLAAQKLNNTWYGFNDAGKVLKFARNNQDLYLDSPTLRRTAVSATYYFEEGASLDELEIYLRTGFNDIGRNAQMWCRFSRDGGHTWSLEKWRDVGSLGDYQQKATWRAQGSFQQLTIEANISEPAEMPLWSDFRMEAA